MQSKKQSAIESAVNTAAGLALSYAAGLIVYPLLGFPVTYGQNAAIVAVFTAISLIRCYVVRRLFSRSRSTDGPLIAAANKPLGRLSLIASALRYIRPEMCWRNVGHILRVNTATPEEEADMYRAWSEWCSHIPPKKRQAAWQKFQTSESSPASLDALLRFARSKGWRAPA